MSALPWVELYRPTDLDSIIGNNQVVDRLRAIRISGNMPNLLLLGPSGVGKTSAVLCLARHLLGDTLPSVRFLQVNGSDENGIAVVRTKIQSFVKRKVVAVGMRGPPKIVLIDEADKLTPDAQQKLQTIIEKYDNHTRFVLLCNESRGIIEAIQSRCALMRFSKLTTFELAERAQFIFETQHIPHDVAAIKALCIVAEGDMRRLLNNAEAAYGAYDRLNADEIFDLCSLPKLLIIEGIIGLCASGNHRKAQRELENMRARGFCDDDILRAFTAALTTPDILVDMKSELRLQMLSKLTDTYLVISNGCSSTLQLSALIAEYVKLSRNIQT